MDASALKELIIGLVLGGFIYYLSTVIPEATFARIVRFVAVLVLVIVAVNFIFALLGFGTFVKIGA